MTARRGFVAAGLAIVAAAAGVGWLLLGGGETRETATGGGPTRSAEAAPVIPEPGLVAGTPSPSRLVDPALDSAAVAPPATTEAYGTLTLHVTYVSNGKPAPSIRVRAAPAGMAGNDEQAGRTDASGTWTAPRFPAGDVTARLDVGGFAWGTVSAGRETVLDLTVPIGVDVTGCVVDADERPVANAGIWLSEGGRSGDVVAHTDGAGRFALSALGRGSRFGARAPGHAPSRLVQVDAATGTLEVTLWLERGAAVRGVVLDDAGRPVGGARVELGERSDDDVLHCRDGTLREGPAPIELTTGDDGRFAAGEVPAGWLSCRARAAGRSPAFGRFDLKPAHTADVTLVLPESTSVSGTVRDAAGRPVPGVTIETPWYDGFGPRSAAAQADGTFVLRDLPAETSFELVANAGAVGKLTRSFSLRSGEHCTWDPILVPGAALPLRVVDAAGEPRANLLVRVRPASLEGSAFGRERHAMTADDGRAVVPDCGDEPLTVRVFDLRESELPIALLRDVRASPQELPITVADRPVTARLHGRVLDAAGGPPRFLRVLLISGEFGDVYPAFIDGATGTFRSSDVPAGDGFLVQVITERSELEFVPVGGLKAGEDRDVGEIRLR